MRRRERPRRRHVPRTPNPNGSHKNRQIGGIFRPKYSAMTCCATGAATFAP